MGKRVYVGNLPFSATEETLGAKFAEFGRVESVKLIQRPNQGGFGFVEMGSDSEAQKAIDKLDGIDYDGSPLRVAEARPPKKKPSHRC